MNMTEGEKALWRSVFAAKWVSSPTPAMPSSDRYHQLVAICSAHASEAVFQVRRWPEESRDGMMREALR